MADRPFPDHIGRYRVLDFIGRGGMGEIYTAQDDRLQRLVALKTISAAAIPDERARARLLQEARAAASLNHPFICTIHEAIEHEGLPVIVMEFVRGESLAQRVTAGPLPAREVRRIGMEAAEALAAAHARGVIHRDISAGNIMLAEGGHVKIMDFGLARQIAADVADSMAATVTSAPRTAVHGVQGTPPYISPEALIGEPPDARSDLYSLGVVLYLIAVGRLPFPDTNPAALTAAIMTRAPVAPRSLVPSIPWALEAAILKLLDKAPAERFGTADALLAVLNEAGGDNAPSATTRRAVAVLPFRALGGSVGDDDLGLGLADATITDLSCARSFLVRPTSAILRYRGGAEDPLRAGRELSVDAVIAGTLQRSGSRLRAAVQMLDTRDGQTLWGTRIDAAADEVFQLQDEVSRAIVLAVETEFADGVPRAETRPRARPEAEQHYLRGRVFLMRQSLASFEAAVSEFDEALRIDPSFARAVAGLGAAHARIGFTYQPDGEAFTRAAALSERALALDPGLPEAHYLKGLLAWSPFGGFQHELALREFCQAFTALPGLNEAHEMAGLVLMHVSLFEEATRELERGLVINPRDEFAYGHLGLARYYAGDWAKALDLFEEAWRRSPSAWAAYQLGLLHAQLGSLDNAERLSATSARRFPEDVLSRSLNAVIGALRGDAEQTDRWIAATIERRKAFGHYHHAQYDIACAHALLGRPEQALTWLHDAAANGFPCAGFFRTDRLLDSLRQTAAFEALVAETAAANERCRRVYLECREPTA